MQPGCCAFWLQERTSGCRVQRIVELGAGRVQLDPPLMAAAQEASAKTRRSPGASGYYPIGFTTHHPNLYVTHIPDYFHL